MVQSAMACAGILIIGGYIHTYILTYIQTDMVGLRGNPHHRRIHTYILTYIQTDMVQSAMACAGILITGGYIHTYLHTYIQTDMVQSAMACAGILIIGGWVDAKKAVNTIEWDLLLLIGSMLGISKVPMCDVPRCAPVMCICVISSPLCWASLMCVCAVCVYM
jgi:hypothetical protein